MHKRHTTCYNGFVTSEWTRSSYCTGGTCVEVAPTHNGVLLRDGKNPHQPPSRFTRAEWAGFLKAIKSGEFDQL